MNQTKKYSYQIKSIILFVLNILTYSVDIKIVLIIVNTMDIV